MKKISYFLLVSIAILTCVACTNKSQEIKSNDKLAIVNQLLTLDQKLKDNNLSFEKIEIKNNSQGAKSCYYYYFNNDNPIVVYYFDENDENYKSIISKGYIENEGINERIEIIASKGIAIEVNNTFENFNTIKDILENL